MKISKEDFDKLQKIHKAYINDKGQEIVNPIPKEVSLALDKPLSIEERVARAVALHVSEMAEKQKLETLADAQDFDLEDDYVVYMSGYELDKIPEYTPENLPSGENQDPDPAADAPDQPDDPPDPVT